MSDSIEVKIHGQLFRLRVEANTAYVKELAVYVDGIMEKMARQSKTPSTDRLAIMAAMRIADNLFQMKEQLQQPVANSNSLKETDPLDQMNQRIQRMITSGDQLLHELGLSTKGSF